MRTTRDDVRAHRELSVLKITERETERRVEKELKKKIAKAKEELDEEGGKIERRRSVVNREATKQNDSTTRSIGMRGDTRNHYKKSGKSVITTYVDDEIADDCKNAKLDYFQNKRTHNESLRNRVKTTFEEEAEHRRREEAKMAAQELIELADAQRKEQLRRRQENQRKELEDTDTDYKCILRDARRAEHRELNKKLEEREKLRQQQLVDEKVREHNFLESLRSDRESAWEKENSLRIERVQERERWRKEKKQLELKHFEGKKERLKNNQKMQDLQEQRAEEWTLVYETTSQPEHMYLPQAVQDEVLCDILTNEDDSEENYDHAAHRQRRKENEAGPSRNREIDLEVRDAKRSIAEIALRRAKQKRQAL